MNEIPLRRANRQNKKDKILIAALEEFARKGYSRTTITEIAKRAKVAVGLVYNFFDNKEDLLWSCVKEYIDPEIDNLILAVSQIKDPTDRLYEFFRQHGLLLEKKPDVARFIAIESRQNDLMFRVKKKKLNPMKRYNDFVKGMTSTAIDKGTRKIADPTTLAYAFVGSLDYGLWQFLSMDSGIDYENLFKQIGQIISAGFKRDRDDKKSQPTP
jgi:AcrR family transcriptional regulator